MSSLALNVIKSLALDAATLSTIPPHEWMYVAASDINNVKEIERIRRHLIKYKDILGSSWSSTLDDPIIMLDPPTGIEIIIDGTRIRVRTPFDQDFVHDISRIKGRVWDGTYNTIPRENIINVVKSIERSFNTYIDIDISDAVWACVGMDETLRAIKIAVLVNNDIIRTVLHKFAAMYDSFSMTWNITIRSSKHLDDVIAYLRLNASTFKFISVNDTRIEKLRRLVQQDEQNKNDLFDLSRTADGETDIRYPDGLTPYPFQVVGVKFIEKTNGKTLIADQMGLGKTIQALLYLYNHPECLPCVVVVPSSIKIKWARETKKWLAAQDDEIFIVSGKNSRGDDDMPLDKRVYIVNYDIVNGRFAELLQLSLKTLIIDEAHYIKNRKAKRTIAVLELCKHIEHVICLTGTPIVNRPIEIWNILVATGNTYHFGGFMNYATRYCAAFKSKYGLDVGGASHLDELYQRLREIVMIRRTKSQVLDQLPPKQRIIIPVQIRNRASYDRAFNNFKKWYKETKNKDLTKGEALVKIGQLGQLVTKGKKEDAIDFITNAYENDGKVIVFAYYVEMIDYILSKLNDASIFVRRLIAGMSDDERQSNIDEFNECETGIIVCSLEVGSVGIDLQSAHTVVFTELRWTPSEHIQAEDRAHRIGQTEVVKIYYIVGIDTIDEDIAETIEQKQRIIDRTLDRDDDSAQSESASFTRLLRSRLN